MLLNMNLTCSYCHLMLTLLLALCFFTVCFLPVTEVEDKVTLDSAEQPDNGQTCT